MANYGPVFPSRPNPARPDAPSSESELLRELLSQSRKQTQLLTEIKTALERRPIGGMR